MSPPPSLPTHTHNIAELHSPPPSSLPQSLGKVSRLVGARQRIAATMHNSHRILSPAVATASPASPRKQLEIKIDSALGYE